MRHRLRRARDLSAGALAALALLCPAADAREVRLAAYGAGVTTCDISVTRTMYRLVEPNWYFAGSTRCSVAVRQTGEASSGGSFGPLCSQFAATCESSGSTYRTSDVVYRVTLVAPPGQAWLAVPADCTGAGTDNLTCELVARAKAYWLA
jgi:hypothetical protein